MTEENYPSKNQLESLPPDQLANLSSLLEHRSIPAGTRLMEEGEQGDGCYFIDSGKVRVELEKNRDNGPLLLGHIAQGGVVGEMNLMGMPTRSASVYAETDVTLSWLSLEKFTSLKNSNPELQSSLISLFSEDITRKVRSTEKSLGEFHAKALEAVPAALAEVAAKYNINLAA
jgi:CRP-like cAMP-binding protein